MLYLNSTTILASCVKELTIFEFFLLLRILLLIQRQAAINSLANDKMPRTKYLMQHWRVFHIFFFPFERIFLLKQQNINFLLSHSECSASAEVCSALSFARLYSWPCVCYTCVCALNFKWHFSIEKPFVENFPLKTNISFSRSLVLL